jgi:hypothetical protein
MQIVDSFSAVAEDVISNEEYTDDDRHNVISAAVLEAAEFCDQNQLYLEEALTVHCVALLMGVEDIHPAGDTSRQQLTDDFWRQLRNAKRMIKEASGASELEKLFRSVSRAKLTSPVIDYLAKMRRQKRRN